MKNYIAVTLPGIEDVLIKDIKEILNSDAIKIKNGRVKFKTDNIDKLVYVCRSLIKVYELVLDFKFESLDEIQQNVFKVKFDIEQPFVARAVVQGKEMFSSREIERLIGEIVFNQGFRVDLDNPKTTVIAEILENRCLIGLLVAWNLHKRDYRIRFHRQSINSCLAYALVRLSHWNKNKVLLDPFTKDGVIPIEAALYAKNVPRGYFEKKFNFPELDKKIREIKSNIYAYDDMLSHVRNSEINMKLAEVKKQINLSKTSPDWLDVKFNEEFVDCIVSNLPFPSPSNPEKIVKKVYTDFFSNAKYILKKKGKMVIVSQKIDLMLNYIKNFKLLEKRQILVGGQSYFIIILVK